MLRNTCLAAVLLLLGACTSIKMDAISPTDPQLAKRISTSNSDRIGLIFKEGGHESVFMAKVVDDQVCGETIIVGGQGAMKAECFPISSIRFINVTSGQYDPSSGLLIGQTLGICILLLPLCYANSIPGQ
jgi:hypothetical protein